MRIPCPLVRNLVRPVSSRRRIRSTEGLIAANCAPKSNPTTAATCRRPRGGTAGGLLAPGVYYVNFTETDGYGETTVSAESGPVTVAAQAAPAGAPTVTVSGTAELWRRAFTEASSPM